MYQDNVMDNTQDLHTSMLEYLQPKLCNRIAKISDSACSVSVCKEFEFNP